MMYKKCITMMVLAISMLLIFSACSYSAHKEYYSNVDNYAEIWDLTGFHHGYEDGFSRFFPETLEGFAVKDFYCRYDQQLPLGEGVQVFLKIQFSDEDMFQAELDRMKALSSRCDEYFEESNLDAYATRLGEDFLSEYALVDNEQLVVHYIFLQNLPKNEIEFDHQFLPIGYTGYGEIAKE